MKSIDIFGQGIGFTVGEGNEKRKTWCGFFITVVVTILILTYGGVKFNTMIHREDTNFQTETKKFAMDPDYDLTADDVEFEVFFRVLEPIYGWDTLNYTSYPIEDIKKYIHVSVGQVEYSFV